MIKYKQVATRKIELQWETGEDKFYLDHILRIIDDRNYQKRQIMGLKNEQNKHK